MEHILISQSILKSFGDNIEKNANFISQVKKQLHPDRKVSDIYWQLRKSIPKAVNESPLGKRVEDVSNKFYKTPFGKRFGEVNRYIKTSTKPITIYTGAATLGGATLLPSTSAYHESLVNTTGGSMPYSSWSD